MAEAEALDQVLVQAETCTANRETSLSDTPTVSVTEQPGLFRCLPHDCVPLAMSNFRSSVVQRVSGPSGHLQSFCFASQLVCPGSQEHLREGSWTVDPHSARPGGGDRRKEHSLTLGCWYVVTRREGSLRDGKDGATGCSVAFETAWKANRVRQGTLRKTNHWQSFISITGVGQSVIKHMRNMKSVSFSDKRYWWIRQSLS